MITGGGGRGGVGEPVKSGPKGALSSWKVCARNLPCSLLCLRRHFQESGPKP